MRALVRSAGASLAAALLALGLPVVLIPAGGASATGTTAGGASATGTAWTVYHGDPLGSGLGPAGASLSPAHPAWTSPSLDGNLFGEPLVDGGEVYVATENDTVYALDASSGHVVWSRHVGTPVPSSELPCGDITPVVGITGTPVIDPARNELFAVADVQVNGQPSHRLFGIDMQNGSIELDQSVDPPGADTPALLQRTGLALDGGNVVFGFGGNYGDCSTYHGWVESVPEAGGSPRLFEVDSGPGQHEGAVWMGGAAPAVTPDGSVWVAAGNGSVTSAGGPYDNSDSVLELSPSLQLVQYFAPRDWYADNAGDRDLGSGAPALLGDGLVVQAGKSQTAFLLQASKLGGIGGQLAETPVCGAEVDGGSAVSGSTVYLPCQAGIVALSVSASPPSLAVQWRSGSGAGGPPVLVGGFVWTISQSGVLDGLDPSTGTVDQHFSIGAEADHFPTPSYGDGLLLAPSATQVHAFAGPVAAPPPPSTTLPQPSTGTAPPATHGATRPAAATGVTSGGASPWVWAGVGAGAVVVMGAAFLLAAFLRRRAGPPRP